MFSRRCLLFALLATCGVSLSAATAEAQSYAPRQYYGHWQKPPSAKFHYRHYYYKPTPTYSGYKHHYVVHIPSKPKHVYYYNPYKKQYWGRCEIDHGGQPLYSMLAEKDRRPNLKDIPESAFPPPSPVPPIPESTDKAPLDLPPDDVPPADVPGIATPAPPTGE